MMSKVARTFDQKTAPPATDAAGFVLDGWGLPLSGPRRRAALADAGKRDPRDHPEDWTDKSVAARKGKATVVGVDAGVETNG